MPACESSSLLDDVSQMAALAVADEIVEGVLPLDRVAHVIKAAIETFILFSAEEAGE